MMFLDFMTDWLSDAGTKPLHLRLLQKPSLGAWVEPGPQTCLFIFTSVRGAVGVEGGDCHYKSSFLEIMNISSGRLLDHLALRQASVAVQSCSCALLTSASQQLKKEIS